MKFIIETNIEKHEVDIESGDTISLKNKGEDRDFAIITMNGKTIHIRFNPYRPPRLII